jgi:dihydroflavonol-4-reductase
MRIGVTGAFGFLGANFVAGLLARESCASGGSAREARARRGSGIVAFASRTRSNPLFDPEKVEVENLDVLDYEGMARAFEGFDVVAHFAGKVDFREKAKRAVWDADAIGAKRVFDAALAAGVGRVLYLSSINVLGEPAPGALADEAGTPYGKPHCPTAFASPEAALEARERSLAGDYRFLDEVGVAYADAKLAAWELAKLYAKERGLPVVTVFPGTAVGAGDLHYAISALVDGVWDGKLGLCFDGATSFVRARDFAAGALLALERGATGESYVLSGRDEHNLSYSDFMELIGRIAREEGGRGIGRPLVLPRGLALAAAAAAERLAPKLGLMSALVRSGTFRNVCTSAKARAELGYEPGPDLAGAIAECRRFGGTAREPHRT